MEMSLILDNKTKGLTEAQIKILMEQFQDKNYLTTQEKHILAMLLNAKKGKVASRHHYMHEKQAAEGRRTPCE